MTDRRRRTFPAPQGLPSAKALSSQPRAVVVGAGIAGLAAATGLAERGISVDDVDARTIWVGESAPGPSNTAAPRSQ
jgi:isorenieratene synthase